MNFAYYCSGHGYGHATRVSALSKHLLSLEPKPYVYIISSAPPHVFADSMKLGAQYRNAKVDPVIQQPLAYRVDRKKSLQVLNAFLDERETLITQEVKWLKEQDIHCVLSDAVFIACAAANRACLPSALITNFTFDSIWSYLSAPIYEAPTASEASQDINHLNLPGAPPPLQLEPDEPIPLEELAPLANRIAEDYRNADILFRLPGYLPFPSFSPISPLPAIDWIDMATQRFYPEVLSTLESSLNSIPLYPSVPFPHSSPRKPLQRQIREAPLLVRHPAPDIYSMAARHRILDSVGVPRELHDPEHTKVLIVSFGGQVIRRPSHSATHSRNGSRSLSITSTPSLRPTDISAPVAQLPSVDGSSSGSSSPPRLAERLQTSFKELPRIATPSHIYIPGAPPASNPSSPTVQSRSAFLGPNMQDLLEAAFDEEPEPRLLPDGWIAIVCGVAKNWGEEDLPEGFYVAPRDTYMPDLTAVGDVLLGKLGYGTCAECVDACTPFVYVPRPLIVEEHGLRHLMENQGVGVLLSQESYEFGDWASKIQEAYEKGKFLKSMKRKMGWDDGRKRAADQLAKDLVSWLDEWWSKIDIQVASEAPLPGSLLPSTSQAGEIGIGGIVSGRPIAV